MKPRLHMSEGRWRCFTRAIFGGRIVGYGRTPREAYLAWKDKA